MSMIKRPSRNTLIRYFRWKFTVEGMYTRNISDVLFQQLNTRDNPLWYG
ncbi:hypothetical protein SAMN05421747_13025, partial [Parapedobacter composti]